jgi:hypothetical protein
MIDFIYFIFKATLAVLFLPSLLVLIGVLGALNSKGQFDAILDDLQAILKWLIPGI